MFYWICFINSHKPTSLHTQRHRHRHIDRHRQRYACITFMCHSIDIHRPRHIYPHYISQFCSFYPTHRACPASQCTVIDEPRPGLSAAGTAPRGKDPWPVLPKNSLHGQQKHGARHPNGNPYGCRYCCVKCFPRLRDKRGGFDG